MEVDGFYLIPPVEAVWMEYETLCQEQLGYRPRRTDKAIFVSHADFPGSLVAGFTLVHTDGPYVLADGYVVSPALDAKGKYNATVFCQHELKRVCHILNRGAIALVSHKGLQTVLGNNEFECSNASLWFYAPSGISRSPDYAPLEPAESLEDSLERADASDSGTRTEQMRGQNVEPTYVEPAVIESGPAKAPRKRGWPKGKPRGPRKRAQADPQQGSGA